MAALAQKELLTSAGRKHNPGQGRIGDDPTETRNAAPCPAWKLALACYRERRSFPGRSADPCRLPACFMIVECLWISDLGNTAMVQCAQSYCTTGFVTTATGTR